MRGVSDPTVTPLVGWGKRPEGPCGPAGGVSQAGITELQPKDRQSCSPGLSSVIMFPQLGGCPRDGRWPGAAVAMLSCCGLCLRQEQGQVVELQFWPLPPVSEAVPREWAGGLRSRQAPGGKHRPDSGPSVICIIERHQGADSTKNRSISLWSESVLYLLECYRDVTQEEVKTHSMSVRLLCALF